MSHRPASIPPALIVIVVLAASCVASFVGGCTEQAPAAGVPEGPLTGHVTITGSSTCAPLVAEIARRFERMHPQARIDVQTGGSSRGIADATAGLAEIGMSSRPLTASESERVTAHTFARDGVAFLVHASNPVTSLSDSELRSIYAGVIDDWSAVGGAAAPITVINRANGRSELDLITAYLRLAPADIEADVVAGENQQGIKQVATDPNAIVYMSVGTAAYEEARGTPIRRLPLRGIEATVENLRSGVFPLGRPLVLVTTPHPTPLAAAFLDFARSRAVHDLVEENAFVAITPADEP